MVIGTAEAVPFPVACQVKRAKAQRDQRIAKQIGKLQVSLEPRSGQSKQALNELVPKHHPIPLDEKIVQVMGRIQPEEQSRFPVGHQDKDSREPVAND
jgi:hypothetical protein